MAGVAALATCSQAVTGFGMALVAVPLLTVVLGPHIGIVTATLFSACFTGFVTWRERRYVYKRITIGVSLAGIVGMPLGLLLLTFATVYQLSIVISCLIFAMAVLLVIPGLPTPRKGLVYFVGLLSGTMLTSTGINGPPLVSAFHAMRLGKRAFRASLQAIFGVQDGCAVIGFVIVGYLDQRALVALVAGIPGIAVGWLAGNWIFYRVRADIVRYIVLGLIGGSGVSTLMTTLL